jgi:hypothetical protein
MFDALETFLDTAAKYESYLLRTWCTASGARRWMIENVMTGERNTFTDLPALVLFLRASSAEGHHNTRARRSPSHRAVTNGASPEE